MPGARVLPAAAGLIELLEQALLFFAVSGVGVTRQTLTFNVSGTQVLSPTTLGGVSYGLTYQTGTLEQTWNVVPQVCSDPTLCPPQAAELFPDSRSYLATYADFGLMRERAVYAHCIHFDDDDRALMRSTGAAAAVSPTSNLFLGSGFFDYEGADRIGFRYGLASDVGGGTSFSPFHTMLAAYYVGREGQTKPGLSLSPQQLWWQHTAGAARALVLSPGPGRPEDAGICIAAIRRAQQDCDQGRGQDFFGKLLFCFAG